MNEVIEAGRAACCTHRHGRCCRGAIRCDGRETAGVHRNSYRSELRPELQQEFCSCVQLRRSCGAALLPWLYALGHREPTRAGSGLPSYPAVWSHVAVLVVRGRSGDSRRALEGAVCGSAAGGSHGTSGWCSNLLCVGRGRFRARDGECVPRTPSCVDAAFAGQRHHRAAPSSRLDEDTGEHRHARGDR